MSNDHLIQLAVQVLIGLAVFSFLQYSVRTAHAKSVVNRRAKVLCAGSLMLAILGIAVVMYYPPVGAALVIVGNTSAVLTMLWLERQTRRRRK